jgi:ParB-like nuclease family protein
VSLLDAFDNATGAGGYSTPRQQAPASLGFRVPNLLAEEEAAASSRQRGVPERVDVNDITTNVGGFLTGAGMTGLQALDIAGKAPAFVYERPIATADALLQEFTGFSPVKATEEKVPLIGDILGAIGGALTAGSTAMAALANSGLVSQLRQNRDQSDDFVVQQGRGTRSQAQTIGELRAEARARGFTDEDFAAIDAGQKGDFDFGDHMVSSNPLADAAYRIVVDPLNLAFGLGLIGKAGKGVGLLAQAARAGVELEKPLEIARASEAIAQGSAKGATWMGLAHYFGAATAAKVGQMGLDAAYVGGRVTRAIPGATAALSKVPGAVQTYRKVAIGTTAVEAGIEFGGNVLEETGLTPDGDGGAVGGFMGRLRAINKAAFDNRPLSQNLVFGLWSAFHMGLPIRDTKSLLVSAKNKALGSDIKLHMVNLLGEGHGSTFGARRAYVVEKLGGEQVLDQMIDHAARHMVFDKIAPALRERAGQFESFDQATRQMAGLEQLLSERLVMAYSKNEIKGRDIAAKFKDWFEGREGLPEGNRYQWNADVAMDRWLRYADVAAPVSQAFRERGDVILGLTGQILAKEDVAHARVLFTSAAKDGVIENAEVQRILDLYPQLLQKGEYWLQYLQKDAPVAKLNSIRGKLRAIENDAPSLRELLHESVIAERKASTIAPESEGPVRPDGSFDPEWRDPDSVAIGVSRYEARKFGVLGNLDDARVARNRPEISAVEHAAGDVLTDAGFRVDRVDQTIGGWTDNPGADLAELEPSLRVRMDSARLPEVRLAAALMGKELNQQAAIITISGNRLRQLGLRANGIEFTWALPGVGRAQLNTIATEVSKIFPGFGLDDTNGVLRISQKREWLPDDIEARLTRLNEVLTSIFPKGVVGDNGVVVSRRPAYIETIGKNASENDLSYQKVLQSERSDPRVQAFSSLRSRFAPADEGRAARVAGQQPEPGSRPSGQAGVESGVVPGEVPQGVIPEPWRADPRAQAVPVSFLEGLPGGNKLGKTDIEALKADILENGIREPIPLEYSQADNTILLSEGNHRLAAAKQLGLTELPVRFVRTTRPLGGKPVRGFRPDEHDYVPGDLRPADIGVPINEPAASPFENIGAGAVETAVREPGYLYHVTSLEDAQSIAGDALRPNNPSYRGEQLTWPDGGTGKRTYFNEDPTKVVGFQVEVPNLLLRVKADKAGKVRREFLAEGSDSYARRKIPASMLEAYGADGQWHPLKTFFEKPLGEAPPELAVAAQATESAFADLPPVNRPDATTQGLRATEDLNARGIDNGAEAGLRSQLVDLSREGPTISPANETAFTETQLALEMAIQGRAESTRGQVLFNAERDAAVSRDIPIPKYDGSLSERPEQFRADMAAMETWLKEYNPAYTLKAPPKVAIGFPENTPAGQALMERTGLAQWLVDQGPLSHIANFAGWLFRPIPNSQLGKAARQAVMNEMLGHGASVRQVEQFLGALENETKLHTLGPLEIRVYRNGFSLPQKAINRIASGDKDLGLPAIFSEKTIAEIGRNNFARLLDRAGNRFIRTLDEKIVAGKAGALDKTLTNMYGWFQHTAAGDTTRMVSKTLYHWFRFITDPRWWAMNMLEADILGGMRYGAKATKLRGADKARPTKATLVHEFGDVKPRSLSEIEKEISGGDTGWFYNRHLAGYVSRAFEAERPGATLEVIRGLAKEDPAVAGLLQRFGGTEDDIVKGIDDMLYGFDTKGPKAYIDEVAAGLKDELNLAEPGMQALLQKVYERNDQLFNDVVHTFRGNDARTNAERLLNSYWLYWPISYQLKAGRWLFDVLTNRAFGKQTNLLGARVYGQMLDAHKERLEKDDAYRAAFEEHPTLWFAAQMLLPITPGDLGVSLSRPVRYAGGAMGLWGAYKNAQDPVTAAGAVLSIGPAYSAELLARVGRELFREPTENLYPNPGSFSPAP